MPLDPDVRRGLIVEPGAPAALAARATDWLPPDLEALPEDERKAGASAQLKSLRDELAESQERLWASDDWAVLVVIQALDAAGKDGLIKHVFSGVNPQGCHVYSFKKPSTEERDHDFLWRSWRGLPGRGSIGIFNRSYYEDVLVVRVHPELLGVPATDDLWRHRYEDIAAFERHLDRERTRVVKLFLHISKEEQRQRLLARLDDPHKNWKFNLADLDERALWPAYVDSYEHALTATSTPEAPWYVLPADRKYVTRLLAAQVILATMNDLDVAYPAADPTAVEEGRRRLRAEESPKTREPASSTGG